MDYREMYAAEIARIGEVNRAELIDAKYVTELDNSGFGIVMRRQQLATPKLNPAWGKAGTEQRIARWQPALEQGGCLYGAFQATRLVGFIILGPARWARSAEIVALFVDRDFRRKGIGAALMAWAEKQAQGLGIEALFLYANPSVSSVHFYRKRGFALAGLVARQIAEDLPGGILMAKRIKCSGK